MDEIFLRVSEAFKSHGSVHVIKGLNMTVPSASIYALLGPSGCGKTTLLNCIVGLMDLDSGSIEMNAKFKSEIGFMPQNLALYLLLNIKETFNYYGKLNGLSQSKIKARRKELCELLELPANDRIIEQLSGGQQRRVSLAITLIHNPRLLILDEPTVGLDPILSQNIWKYLLRLSRDENKTVIITTHYIEEAKAAHVVGLMRRGILLCEDHPQHIMVSQNCDTMEKAFLQLSSIQQNSILQCNSEQEKPRRKSFIKRQNVKSVLRNSSTFTVYGFSAEFIKNLYFIWRNKSMLVFLFGLPLAVSVLFNLAIGHTPTGLKLGVVDEELPGGLSHCTPDLSVGCNVSNPISCRYINKLSQRDIELLEYRDVGIAREAVLKNTIWGIIEFPHNYSSSLLDRIALNLKTKPHSVDQGSMNVWLDMSNHNIGTLLQVEIFRSFMETLKEFFSDCGWPTAALNIPVKFNPPVYGSAIPNLNHYASPAVMILLIFYLPMSYTIGVIVQEKLTGVLERSIVSGLSLIEVFLSHAVIQTVLLVVQMAITMFILYYVYGSPFIGDPFLTTLLLLLQGICGLSFGFLVSVLFDKMTHATFASLGSVFSYFFLSGMVWPQQGIYFILHWFRWIAPVSYSVETLRAISARAWNLQHPEVYAGFLSVISWIIIYCLGSYITLRIRGGLAVK